jgi:hypothetical protein
MDQLASILHNSHAINLTSLAAATMAGLYGYYQILGRRGGLLRQALVGVPSGLTFAVAAYIFDIQSQASLSGFPGDVLGLPPHSVTSFTLAIIAFAPGFMIPVLFGSGNLDKTRTRMVSANIIVSAAVTGFWVAFSLQFEMVRLNLFQNSRPPFYVTLIGSAIVSVTVNIWGLRMFFWPRNEKQRPNHPLLTWSILILGGVLSVSPFLVLLVYLVIHVGWLSAPVLAGAVLLYLVAFLAQLWVDHLGDDKGNQLYYISLAFFLVAVVLQVYQAVAL